MDWGVVLTLAAITWLDGVRRVPPGALVLRRTLGGRWHVADSADAGRTFQLVAWWNPVTLPLILPAGGIATGGAALGESTGQTFADRLARSEATILGLRVLGAAVLAAIVVGIPAAVARSGAWGFATGITVALLLALVTAVVALCGARRLAHSWRQAARVAAPLLSPFGAPRAAEMLLERALAGAPATAVARRLLGPETFAAWIRPQAYDALHGATDPLAANALVTVVGESDLAAIVDSPPAECAPGESYCRRCARVYRAGTSACAECAGVRLTPVADNGWRPAAGPTLAAIQ